MDVELAVERVLQRQSIAHVAAQYRTELLADLGIDPRDAEPEMLAREARQFAARLARRLGDRHGSDPKVGTALEEWARRVDDYEVYDALLSNFADFPSRPRLLRRGRILFPRAMTEHWGEE